MHGVKRYNICSAWFLDIRIYQLVLHVHFHTLNVQYIHNVIMQTVPGIVPQNLPSMARCGQ